MDDDRRAARPAGRPGPDSAPNLRTANLARVLGAVLGAQAPPTRADVAGAVGVTRATASRLVDDLLRGGVLVELDRDRGAARGRPGTPLEASPGRFVAVGLQVDVGSLSALVVNLRGDVVAERVVDADLRGSSPRRVLGRLSRMRDRLLSTLPASTVLGTGLALPGLVSSASRTLLRAPNLGWADVVVPDLMDAGPGAALLVGNEADLASTTVSFERPGRPSALADFVYLSGEVGIGGAVVLGGRPLGGSHGWAGEVGHVTVDPRGPRCACGSTGCLELYAGRRALLAAAGLPDDATPADLLARAREGDRTAQRAVDRAGRALGTALAVVVNVVDVPDVVLGGHLRDLTPLVGPVVERTLGERVLSAGWAAPTVRAAEPHRAPGALGAAYRVLQRLVDDPAAWLGVASGAAQGRT